MDLEMLTRPEDGYLVVTPHGEIDLGNVKEFREELTELIIQGHVHLLIDLDEITFIDSLGFGALVAVRRKVHALKGSLGIVCSNARLLHLFTVTGLDRVFTITASAAAQPPLAPPDDDGGTSAPAAPGSAELPPLS